MPVRQRNEMPGASIMRGMMPIMNSPYYGGTVEHWFNPTMGGGSGYDLACGICFQARCDHDQSWNCSSSRGINQL